MESICECKLNNLMNNELIEGNVLLQNTLGEITDLLKSSNVLVLKCYKDVLSQKYFLKGSGGFIIITIGFIELIFSCIFLIYDMAVIRKYIYNLTEYFMAYINKNTNNNKPSPIKKKKNENHLKMNINKKRKKSTLKLDENNSKSLRTNKSEGKMITYRKNTINKNNNIKIIRKKSKFDIKNNNPSLEQLLLKAKNLCGNINMEEYLKPNLDDMEYDDAIKLDKRPFCVFFSEKLKEKQIIMDTFFHKEILIPMSIKIILLLLNIDLYFVINGLFFNEEYISQLFNSDEEETFFSFIPRSISRFFYATMVGFIIGFIIDCIFIEEKKIKRIFLREKDDPFQLRYEISVTVKSIKTRYTIFIFLCIFISIVSWYYISCFNNVYPGVRNEWIKSSIAIIIIMQIISILIVLLQAILRGLSFHYKSEKLYKMKQFIS